MPDFLSSTVVGRLMPPLEEGGDAGSEASEWELQKLREQEEKQEAEAEAEELWAAAGSGAGEEWLLFLPTPSSMISADEESEMAAFPMLFSFVVSLGRYPLGTGLGGGQRGACNMPPLRGLRIRKLGENIRRHDLHRSHASMNKQKKNHDSTDIRLSLFPCG